MKQEFMKTDFVLDALAEHIREGHFPTDETAGYLDSMPLVDALRQRTSQSDVPNLVKIIEEQSRQAAGLAVSLLRQ